MVQLVVVILSMSFLHSCFFLIGWSCITLVTLKFIGWLLHCVFLVTTPISLIYSVSSTSYIYLLAIIWGYDISLYPWLAVYIGDSSTYWTLWVSSIMVLSLPVLMIVLFTVTIPFLITIVLIILIIFCGMCSFVKIVFFGTWFVLKLLRIQQPTKFSNKYNIIHGVHQSNPWFYFVLEFNIFI